MQRQSRAATWHAPLSSGRHPSIGKEQEDASRHSAENAHPMNGDPISNPSMPFPIPEVVVSKASSYLRTILRGRMHGS